jgi:hydrogenase maturation protein HypF
VRTSWRAAGRGAAGRRLAARQPWRNLLAHCLAFVPDWQIIRNRALRQRNWPLLAQAIERGINAPRASSCGRLFDAVACALDCAPESLSYEGEAACRLEALAASCPASAIRLRCRGATTRWI